MKFYNLVQSLKYLNQNFFVLFQDFIRLNTKIKAQSLHSESLNTNQHFDSNYKKMKKSSQSNRSALLVAGQNSLSHINQQQQFKDYQTINYQKQKYNSPSRNQLLYESNVRQVYKRPPQTDEYLRQKEVKYERRYNQNQKYQNQLSNQKFRRDRKHQNGIPNSQYKNKNTLKSQEISRFYSQNNNNSNEYNIKNQEQIDPERIKKIMMKLTFVRLRKIQALVRGFLVRRKIYPKLLQEYFIAKSVLSLIEANVVYRQISTIIMETITFPKYQDETQVVEMYKGRQKILEDLVYDGIVSRVIRNQLKPIVQQAVTQRGLLMNRPQITFGFNLRDPLQLILYEKLLQYMNSQLRQACSQSITQYAYDRRELFIIDEWIEKYNFLHPLYEEIANQLLQQNIGEYIVVDILNKIVKEAAFVVADNTYNQEVSDWYMKTIDQIKQEVDEVLVEEAVGEAITQLGYGIQKSQGKQSLI